MKLTDPEQQLREQPTAAQTSEPARHERRSVRWRALVAPLLGVLGATVFAGYVVAVVPGQLALLLAAWVLSMGLVLLLPLAVVLAVDRALDWSADRAAGRRARHGPVEPQTPPDAELPVVATPRPKP